MANPFRLWSKSLPLLSVFSFFFQLENEASVPQSKTKNNEIQDPQNGRMTDREMGKDVQFTGWKANNYGSIPVTLEVSNVRHLNDDHPKVDTEIETLVNRKIHEIPS